jgi:hypothetical protein
MAAGRSKYQVMKTKNQINEKMYQVRTVLINQLSEQVETKLRKKVWNRGDKQIWERIGNGVGDELEAKVLDQEWERIRQILEI